MTVGFLPTLSRWLTPERNWKGRTALIPVVTCYRTLDSLLWLIGLFGTFAVIMAFLRGAALLRANPVFWLFLVMQVPLLASAVFRGWPFMFRYSVLALQLFIFTLGSAAVLGPTPNWSFMIVLLIAVTSLFSGTRTGFAAVIVVLACHILVAWGWVIGRLPAFMPSADSASTFVDFTSVAVWVRVLVVAAGLLSGLVILMRLVLRDLNNALQEANSTLQKLAVEQEYRARAEEARLKAELATREAQKFDALGRLASGVAHDFNNALCIMKCWSSFLSEGNKDPLVQEAMTEIRTATDSATHLTSHLLAFSRSDPAKKEVVDLADVVRMEGKTLTRLLPKNVVVQVDIGAPVYVRLGRGQLQEIILNLAINARDAMPQGGRLGLRVASVDLDGTTQNLPAGRYAQLEVSDTGEGMDEATQARIFEPFFTTKLDGRGTGLGLSMVYGLMAGASGNITVRSEPRCGTSFTLLLPEAGATERQAEAHTMTILTQTRCRVLVAEDQPEIRQLIERILSQEGFPTATAANGDKALELLAVPGSKFGLLMVDGIMPGASVGSVIELALRLNPECRIVVISALMKDPLLLQKLQDGVFQLLPKPFDAGQLREAVNLALAGKV